MGEAFEVSTERFAEANPLVRSVKDCAGVLLVTLHGRSEAPRTASDSHFPEAWGACFFC